MFYRVLGIRLGLQEKEAVLLSKAAKIMGLFSDDIEKIQIYRKSLDARKGKLSYLYSVNVWLKSGKQPVFSENCKAIEKEDDYSIPCFSFRKKRPIVVGFGPAGMFAALLLARAGLCPIVLERGRCVEERQKDVSRFRLEGVLSPESNIQFGEGGAGTFSDGKLNTLLRDKNERGRFVLREFVKAGAPQEILYENKPHIGTDRLCLAVKGIRKEILRLGGEVRFENRLVSFDAENGKLQSVVVKAPTGEEIIPCETLFLAIGHSARDTFLSLWRSGLMMEKKIFSVGVRIEHLQEKISSAQYGKFSSMLPAADYKLAVPTGSGKTLYTFCMCPGGEVVPAASEEGGVVTNGMSCFARDGKNANSALLMNILPEELPDDLFAGFHFQRDLEEKAFRLGGGAWKAPCQRVEDFLQRRKSISSGEVIPTYARGVEYTDLSVLFPISFADSLREGIEKMGQILPGFSHPDALLTGVESRATCPVRMVRNENFEADISGIYPIGEGAGYAGGIMSSAMDGMKAAEAYFAKLQEE